MLQVAEPVGVDEVELADIEDNEELWYQNADNSDEDTGSVCADRSAHTLMREKLLNHLGASIILFDCVAGPRAIRKLYVSATMSLLPHSLGKSRQVEASLGKWRQG